MTKTPDVTNDVVKELLSTMVPMGNVVGRASVLSTSRMIVEVASTRELTVETFVVSTLFVTSRVITEVESTREVTKKNAVVDSV